MKIYSASKNFVVGYVEGLMDNLSPGCVSTMIIKRDRSGVYYVTTATDEWLADIALEAARSFFSTPMNTSQENTPDG